MGFYGLLLLFTAIVIIGCVSEMYGISNATTALQHDAASYASIVYAELDSPK
jgi:Flp pilus assembly pilin Flp